MYEIVIANKKKKVFCDMDTLGGGWTVIQRRGDFEDEAVDMFFRKWDAYKEGFGKPNQSYWIGLEAMHHLTTDQGPVQLRIELADFEGNSTAFMVNNFTVGDEESKYRIFYRNYNNIIGNSLPPRFTKFSTVDNDNDAWMNNCAERFTGAWWYSACHNCNPNGLYLRGNHTDLGTGVNWYHWTGYYYSLKDVIMKVRVRKS